MDSGLRNRKSQKFFLGILDFPVGVSLNSWYIGWYTKSVMFVILAVGVPLKVVERGLYIVFFADYRVILSEFIKEGIIEVAALVAVV